MGYEHCQLVNQKYINNVSQRSAGNSHQSVNKSKLTAVILERKTESRIASNCQHHPSLVHNLVLQLHYNSVSVVPVDFTHYITVVLLIC